MIMVYTYAKLEYTGIRFIESVMNKWIPFNGLYNWWYPPVNKSTLKIYGTEECQGLDTNSGIKKLFPLNEVIQRPARHGGFRFVRNPQARWMVYFMISR